MSVAVRTATILLCSVMTVTPITAVSGQTTVQDIYERAQARHDLMKSCRVTYTVTTRQLARLPADQADSVQIALQPYRVHFCFEGERRKLLHEPIVPPTAKKMESFEGVNPLSELTVFDGQMSVNYFETSIATLAKGKHPRSDQGEMYCESALGIALTDQQRATFDNGWFYPHCLRSDPQGRPQYAVQSKAEAVNGVPCIVVGAPGYDKLWIDPKLNYAYRKRERFHSPDHPHLIYRDSLSDFVRVAEQLYVPRRVVREVFPALNNPSEYWDKPYLIMRLDVSKVSLNDVTDADFRVVLPSGSYVIDDSTGKVYQVPGQGFDILSDLADKGHQYLLGDSGPPTGARWWRRPIVITALAALVIIVAWILFRRKMRG